MAVTSFPHTDVSKLRLKNVPMRQSPSDVLREKKPHTNAVHSIRLCQAEPTQRPSASLHTASVSQSQSEGAKETKGGVGLVSALPLPFPLSFFDLVSLLLCMYLSIAHLPHSTNSVRLTVAERRS
jgi:hypothetical protein